MNFDPVLRGWINQDLTKGVIWQYLRTGYSIISKMTYISFRSYLTRWCNHISILSRVACKGSTEIKSSCANSYSSNAWSTHENRRSMVHEAFRMTCVNSRDSNIQLSESFSSNMETRCRSKRRKTRLEATRGLETQGPPNCKMLTVFLFVVCSSINQNCYGSVIKCVCGLFGDSPCRDSRRDKNKPWGR